MGGRPGRQLGSGTIMKKVAVTALVLALGLAACNNNAADNNAANETAVENNAETDVNAATNDATAVADNALNAADNAVNAAGNAVDNASDAVSNAATHQYALVRVQMGKGRFSAALFLCSVKVIPWPSEKTSP